LRVAAVRAASRVACDDLPTAGPGLDGVGRLTRFTRSKTGKPEGMARYVELRRHTDGDGDALTEEGVRAALDIGRELAGPYQLLVSSGAQRATQTLARFACMLGEPVAGGAVVEAGVRSSMEDRWRAAYQSAGSGELSALREADPELVREDSAILAAALRRVLERPPEGARALAVGHSPTNEAAVLGLTGATIEPMSKGAACSWSATATKRGSNPLLESVPVVVRTPQTCRPRRATS
jgi:broad specificity phosphatase PhoE